jgi:hypothetical protein
MTRWLRKHAETVTAACVGLSILLGGLLAYLVHLSNN